MIIFLWVRCIFLERLRSVAIGQPTNSLKAFLKSMERSAVIYDIITHLQSRQTDRQTCVYSRIQVCVYVQIENLRNYMHTATNTYGTATYKQ